MNRAGYKYGGDLPDLIGIRIIKRMIFDKDNFHRFLEYAPIDRNSVRKEIDKFVHIPKQNRIISYSISTPSQYDKITKRIDEAREWFKKEYPQFN